MTQEHPSKLSFSIEESVWLNKGQEVKEVLSMSLEPEITIEENNQNVCIKGGLRLLGEYIAVSREEAELQPDQPLEDQITYRSVEEFHITDEGKGEIKHFFPIDVTIPTSRIHNLADVYVKVESFDYDLPEKSCIQLTADVTISGMSTQQEVDREDEDYVEDVDYEEEGAELEEGTFSFEAKKADELEVTHRESPPTYEESAGEIEEQEIEEELSMETEREEEPEVASRPIPAPKLEVAAKNEKQPLEYLYKKKDKQEGPKAALENEETVPDSKEEPALAMMRSSATAFEEEVEEEREEVIEHVGVQEEDDEPVESEEVERPRKEENALYLTKMLTKGEEKFSRWKMCIIQENESLDAIAERYDIPASTLIRFNRLKEDQVEEGQILYIPVTNQS
ncbi:stage VI sporulation protein D [Alkalihalobacillus pseudalcaliphilus]|uniref:stage VI sporulation protein D n=1 Tax=Alkalihalobacillus pseudalcaliphilus TaxID=79884 RepID=UPI00064DC8A0|nr:stage VI sporulation protein D [Alkalihalobacillus pseudalcaliphilus]KMK74641.1 hypothetical protein AB990_19280 [Alkalihalobacillus pseudalcaliphilus]